MKKIIAVTCLMVSMNTFGQDCTNFLFFQKDKTIEMTIYNNAGEVNGKKINQVLDVSTAGDTTISNLTSEIFSKTGKSIAKSNSVIKCSGGIFMVDMKMNMPQQSPFGGNGEATVGNEYLEFPSSVHVGDQLKDGGFTMNIKMGPMQGSVTISITQRKVVAQETITTTAGSWSCFKINSVNTVTRNMAGRDLQPIITETTEWYAPGVGIIKSQSSSGYSLITSIK